MVSPLLIKLAYVFGAVALLIVGIDSLGAYITAPHRAFRTCNDFGYCTNTSSMLPFSILLLTLGNLLWRLLCESAILFFIIHERLRRIEQNTASGRAPSAKGSAQPSENVTEGVADRSAPFQVE